MRVACTLLYPIFKLRGTYCILSNENWVENLARQKAIFCDIDVDDVDVVGVC